MLTIAVILGIIEGLTEFLPVSSTGHLIIAGHLLGFTDETADTFEVFIQLGAILAVVVLYWRRFVALLPYESSGVVGSRRESGARELRGVEMPWLFTVRDLRRVAIRRTKPVA